MEESNMDTSENFEQWLNLNKNLNLPLSEFNKTAAEIFKRSAEQNLEIYAETFSRLTNQLKRLSTVKKPEEFIALQKECFNENVTALIENSHKITQSLSENMQELTRCFTSFRDPMATTEKVMEKVMGKQERHANVK